MSPRFNELQKQNSHGRVITTRFWQIRVVFHHEADIPGQEQKDLQTILLSERFYIVIYTEVYGMKTGRELFMMLKLITTLLIAITALSSAVANAGDSFMPRLNLIPGDSYLCTMDMSTHIKQNIGGRDQAIDQDLTTVWDYSIQSKDENGDYEIAIKYLRVKSTQKSGLQTVSFDSDDSSEYVDPSMIGYKILVGSELRMRLTPAGKVTELSGFDKVLDRIIEELNIPESPQRDKTIEGIRGQFGENALRQSIEQMTIIYPDDPVTTGQSWNISYEMNFGLPMRVESVCTLLSREDGIADIDLVSTIGSNPNSEDIDMGMFTLRYDIEGSQKGLINLDEESGLPVKSDIGQKFTGTVSVSGANDLEEDNWPISGDGRVVITFKKR